MRLVTYNPFYTNRCATPADYNDVAQSPSVNILENDKGYHLDIVSPGFAKEDFKLELKNRQLTISAEKKNESESNEGEKVWRKEYAFSSFSRSFQLPKSVDGNAIEAAYEQGVLKVFIPKMAVEVPPVKTIEIV